MLDTSWLHSARATDVAGAVGDVACSKRGARRGGHANDRVGVRDRVPVRPLAGKAAETGWRTRGEVGVGRRRTRFRHRLGSESGLMPALERLPGVRDDVTAWPAAVAIGGRRIALPRAPSGVRPPGGTK